MYFCRNKRWVLSWQTSFLSQQNFCHDKHTSVATTKWVLSWQMYFCRNKRRVLSWQMYFCRNNKMGFVMTNVFLSQQQNGFCHDKCTSVATTKWVLSWQMYFCRNKRRVLSWQTSVMTKMILVAAPTNDRWWTLLTYRRGELMPERMMMNVVDIQERRVDAREDDDERCWHTGEESWCQRGWWWTLLTYRRGELMPERMMMNVVDIQERRVDAREDDDERCWHTGEESWCQRGWWWTLLTYRRGELMPERMVTSVVIMQERGVHTQSDRRPAMESQAAVWFGLSPRHQGEDVPHWPNVCTSAHEHDHHWLHDDLLQVSHSSLLTIVVFART